jgi:hypothetical protein
VARELADHYGSPRLGSRLKQSLFGSQAHRWWQVPDYQLVDAVVQIKKSIWDVGALDLERRLEREVSRGRGVELAAMRPRQGPKPVRAALTEALRLEADLDLLLQIMDVDPDLGIDVLVMRHDLTAAPRLWRGISNESAEALLTRDGINRDALEAAALGGQSEALVRVLPIERFLEVAYDAGGIPGLRQASRHLPQGSVDIPTARPTLQLALWLGGYQDDAIDPLPLLEGLRAEPDDLWFEVAAAVLASQPAGHRRRALETVFGPLHWGITDDRVPSRTWEVLDRVLPPASDPALRLRRLLVEDVRSEKWSGDALARALSDSGPYIDQIKGELQDDDQITTFFKGALKTIKRHSPF